MDASNSSSTQQTHQRALREQATTWLLTLQYEYSAETETAFQRWLQSSAEHMQAFLEMTALDRNLDGLDERRLIDVESFIAEVRQNASNVVAIQPSSPALPTTSLRPLFVSDRVIGRRRLLGIAAGITMLVAVGGASWWTVFNPVHTYTTAVGEQRSVKLDDGSIVQLNTRSRIEVRFTELTREIKLIDGEALFTVEHEAYRPFKVLTPNAVVQAVGTQFNVYSHREATTVSVVEGRVKLFENKTKDVATTPEDNTLTLQSGEVADVENGGRIVKQPGAKVAKAVAWRQRQLTFDHDSMGYVADQFNRYNKLQIQIEDPKIRARQIEGVFNADQPQALMAFLELNKALTVQRNGNTIVIRARE